MGMSSTVRPSESRKVSITPVLLTSAFKASTEASAAARAFLAEWDDTEDRQELDSEATGAGASVLYYSAAAARDLTITIDLFEKPRRSSVLDKISKGLGAAAAFPPLALALASDYLLIRSQITKVAGDLVNEFKSDRHSFAASQQVYVADGYPKLTEPRFAFFSPDIIDMETSVVIVQTPSGRPYLQDNTTRKPYRGPNAYVICRYAQDAVADLLDFDVRAEALALLDGWKPDEGVEVGELLNVLSAGIGAVRGAQQLQALGSRTIHISMNAPQLRTVAILYKEV